MAAITPRVVTITNSALSRFDPQSRDCYQVIPKLFICLFDKIARIIGKNAFFIFFNIHNKQGF
jgi:hypothetical protein